MWINSIPKLRSVIGGAKTRIYFQANVCRTCVLAVPRIIRMGLSKFGRQAKPLKYSEKKNCNLLPIKARCSKVRAPTSIHIRRWHRHRRSRHWRVHSKMPGCCLLVAAAFMILFSVNWWCVNQVFRVRGIFNSHNSHVWPEANPHATSVHRHQQNFAFNVGVVTVHDFWLGLTCYPDGSVYSFTGCFWRESYQLHVVPARRGCGSLWTLGPRTSHCHSDFWIGRGGPVAWPPRSPDLTPTDFFLWDHIKILIYTSSVDSEEDLITRIVGAAANTRQHPFILSAHVNLCCVGVECLSRSVAGLLNICSKLVRNTPFSQSTSVMLLDFQALSDPIGWSVG